MIVFDPPASQLSQHVLHTRHTCRKKIRPDLVSHEHQHFNFVPFTSMSMLQADTELTVQCSR